MPKGIGLRKWNTVLFREELLRSLLNPGIRDANVCAS